MIPHLGAAVRFKSPLRRQVKNNIDANPWGSRNASDTARPGLESSSPGLPSDSGAPLDALLEGIGEGFFALDASWRFIAFNPSAEALFGLSRADVIGKPIWEVSPGIVGTEFERRYRKVMSERTRQEFEAYTVRRPGRYHEIRAFPFGDGIGAAFRDITDRQQAARALRERERDLARVQRIGGMGGWEADLAAGLAHRSREYAQLHGMLPGVNQETREQWLARVHPDDRATAENEFFESLASSSAEYKAEYRIVRPIDGEVCWLRSVAEIERDSTGRAVRVIGADLDVTDRKSAEQAAKASEGRLLAITDALPVLISYVDKDWTFRFANKPYEVWFERPLAEIIGRKLEDLLDAEMFAARRPFVARALTGETVTYETDFVRSGQIIHTEIVHVPHRDEDGRVIGMYSVVQDVTARRLAERVLAESEERFRSIANSAPVPMWVTRLGGRRDFINRAYQDFLAVSYDEAVNFDWRKALHPDDLARIYREQQIGEGSLRPFTLEARYRRGDGLWRWLRSESQPRWGPSGEHIGFIGVAHDVTASKEAEQTLTEINQTLETRIAERTQQLTATEALIQTFFNHSSECHAVMVEESDGQFRYEEANPATLQLYGKTREQVVGKTIREIFGAAAAAELGAHLTACLSKGGPYGYERMLGEATIEAVATLAPGEPGAPRRLFVSAHDVTERRRLEQQLRQSQKMEAVGQLTGGVAHDFNNLLTLVLGGLEGIGRQLANLPDQSPVARIERFRDMALQGAKRAAALTSRLLAFSRQQSLAPQSLDANELVAGLCELMRRTLGEAIVLETVMADGLWRTFADPNQLENALLNLALNARDAMPDGGKLTIETANAILNEAYVSSLNDPVEPGEYVRIAVADTGAGMDRPTRERAFDPFFTTKEVGKGTGLGLSQVYGFARQSAGHVKIYSEVGQGATVKIYLPRRSGNLADRTENRASNVSRSIGLETILLVEDDEALRNYGIQVLEELGYRVLDADSGAAALAVLDGDQHIDLLLTDIVMPGGVNGRQLADQAARRRPGLKVLFMTGYAPNEIVNQGRLDAQAHLIGKPFSFEELSAKVRECLNA
jgi:PAS domain S-box-containing protein